VHRCLRGRRCSEKVDFGALSFTPHPPTVKIQTSDLPGPTDGRNGGDTVTIVASRERVRLAAKCVAPTVLVAVVSFLTLFGLFYGRGPGDAWVWLAVFFLAVGLAAALTAAVTAVMVARAPAVVPGGVTRGALAAWRNAGGWTAFLFGCVLMLPAFALYTPRLAGDPDSSRLVASILYVQQNGFDYLVDSQEVLLPHIVLSPIVAIGGLPALQLFDVLAVIVLGGVVAFILWSLTRSPLVALAGVLALSSLSAILERDYRLPMYPTMLSFGFLGVYLAHRAIVAETGSRRWRNAGLAGVCLVLALEAHQVGQLFLVVTALLIVTARPRAALAGLGRVYLAVVVLSIPRFTIDLMEGGLSHLFSYRVDYWVTKGYLQSIQVAMFSLPVRDTLGEYARKAPDSLFGVWGWSGVLTLALGLVGLLAMSSPLRRFALACTGFMLAVALYRRLPFYTRYFSLLLVGNALAAGLAFQLLNKASRARRVAGALALVGLVVTAVLSYGTTIRKLQGREATFANGLYARFAAEIPPRDGVIGTRSNYLNFVSADVRTYGGQFLTEREYVTFLTWPSDAAVIDVMRRHDVDWIFVPQNPWKWVKRYNDVWLVPNYGREARYYREVTKSPSFCRALKVRGAALYKLDPRGGDASVLGERPRRCEESSP
jgi:hypothetical protein